MKEQTVKIYKKIGRRLLDIIKWIVMGFLTGILVGGVGTAFSYLLSKAAIFRDSHLWIVYLLPVGGLMIVGLYKLMKVDKDNGTNLVLTSISGKDELPFKMAPLIFLSTVISHFFGASVGREGAALQLGGSLGNTIGESFGFRECDRKILIMTGMSAAFSALFGTPAAAAVFAVEVAVIGTMYIQALLPCVIAAYTASRLPLAIGIKPERLPLGNVPDMSFVLILKLVVLAGLCGVLAIVFCVVMKKTKIYAEKLIKNPWLRVVAGAAVFIGITALTRSTDYYGTGMNVIEMAVTEGEAVPYAFALKLILTALMLGVGFKGGEIVPTFFVGATFGCVIGKLLGISPGLAAAAGMASLFCGVTNCPFAAAIMCFELFGFESAPYILIVTAISYAVSGYCSLYSGQYCDVSKYSLKMGNTGENTDN